MAGAPRGNPHKGKQKQPAPHRKALTPPETSTVFPHRSIFVHLNFPFKQHFKSEKSQIQSYTQTSAFLLDFKPNRSNVFITGKLKSSPSSGCLIAQAGKNDNNANAEVLKTAVPLTATRSHRRVDPHRLHVNL